MLQEAEELLALGTLPKDLAQKLGSAFYTTGQQLPCGHIAHQFVADDRCRDCVRQERNANRLSKEALELLA